MVVAIVLAKRSLKYLGKATFGTNYLVFKDQDKEIVTWVKVRSIIVLYANATYDPASALFNRDTMLYLTAKFSLYTSPSLFFEFMTYCANNGILSSENYKNILTYIQIRSGSKNINSTNVQSQSTAQMMHVLQAAPVPVYLGEPPPDYALATLNTAAFNTQSPTAPYITNATLWIPVTNPTLIQPAEEKPILTPVYM